MDRNLAVGLVAAAVVAGGTGGWVYATTGHHEVATGRPVVSASAAISPSASATPSPASTPPTPSPSPTPSSSPTGPALAWDSYDGVTIGESMTAAAKALGGRVVYDKVFMVGGQVSPKPSHCGTSGEQLIAGITPGVHIASHGVGGADAVVDFISFDRGVGVGPLGIASGMTLAQARSASGQPLTPTTNPATGGQQFELPHGNLTFAFLADPLVRNLTLVRTSELHAGGIFDGGVDC